MKSGIQGLSLTQQQKVVNNIQRSREADRVGDFRCKINDFQKSQINILLKEKIELRKKVFHNMRELENIKTLQKSKKYPHLKEELERASHVADEVIYKHKERIRELSCARIAAIYDVSQTLVSGMEAKIKRKVLGMKY